MSARPATIKDIAKMLNISVSTVSRALRGVPEVNPEKRKAILDLARSLNYQPNQAALSLVLNRSRNIGVVMPESVNIFFSSIIKGIQDIAFQTGYNVVFTHSNENFEREVQNLEHLVSSRVDGILLCLSQETSTVDHLRTLLAGKIPFVLFDRVLDMPEAFTVVVNDYKGAYEATSHLIQGGCKRIVHLGGPQHISTFKNRAAGYAQALADYNLENQREYFIAGGFTERDGIRGMETLLKHDIIPDGIFAVSDSVALGAMYVLRKNGFSIPGDVSVIGFSNENFSPLIQPSLSTVSQHPFKIGQARSISFLNNYILIPKPLSLKK